MVFILKKNEFYELKWDSNYFNIPSYRINLYTEIENINEIINKTEKYKFITIYNYKNNETNNYLLRKLSNCFLADVNVCFERKINNKENNITDKNIKILNNYEGNNNILNIAKKSFQYSRFLNDKTLEKEKSTNIYYNWTKNSFNCQNKYFCLYKDKGFLLFNIENDVATIELIAVDNNENGKGLGTKLIDSLNSFCIANNIQKIIVGTQLNNLIAQKFYLKNKFNVVQYNSIYHYWNEENKI